MASLVLACVTSKVIGQPISIKNGFLTGEQLLQMSEFEKNSYSMGLINGMLLAPFFGGEKSELFWFENCITGMTSTQLSAIFTKYLRENPQDWNLTPHTSLYNALRKSCPK